MKTIKMSGAISGATLLSALAACNGDNSPVDNRVAEATVNYQQSLEILPVGQRNAVFIRAIRDGGLDCQHVEDSRKDKSYRGMPVWKAKCSDGVIWTIVIGDNGIAQILDHREGKVLDSAE